MYFLAFLLYFFACFGIFNVFFGICAVFFRIFWHFQAVIFELIFDPNYRTAKNAKKYSKHAKTYIKNAKRYSKNAKNILKMPKNAKKYSKHAKKYIKNAKKSAKIYPICRPTIKLPKYDIAKNVTLVPKIGWWAWKTKKSKNRETVKVSSPKIQNFLTLLLGAK